MPSKYRLLLPTVLFPAAWLAIGCDSPHSLGNAHDASAAPGDVSGTAGGGAGAGGVGTGGMASGGGGAGGVGTDGMASGGAGMAPAGSDPTWAEWPIPNDPVDVAAGAPNAEAYTDNGDGTVADMVTGLIWQQAVPRATFTWAQAVAYCPTLTLGGHGDWRLPSRIELVSIVSDVGLGQPVIDERFFPTTPTGVFWSASPVPGMASAAWAVLFSIGSTYYYVTSDAHDARCVRTTAGAAPAPPARYTYPTTGTVYDTRTKLTWQQTASSTTYTWADAKTACATLSLGGMGWRLPTMKELLSIVYESRSTAPLIDPTAFPASHATNFWSLSPVAISPSFAWYVSFTLGSTDSSLKTEVNDIRCVR